MRKIISAAAAILCLASVGMTVQADAAVGSYVTFGSYEQDNDLTNGAEPIEWLVLETEGDKALLISRYGLDVYPYHTEYVDVTWENSALRAWLNSEFVGTAFSDDERKAILTTEVDNSDSQGFDFTTVYDYAEEVTGGGNTQDEVFLLSYADANRYFEMTYTNDKNSAPRVAPTEYAREKGAKRDTKKKTSDGDLATWWWLRSPGSVQSYASRVSPDGTLSLDTVDNGKTAVRPALWVDLSSGLF